MTKEISNGYGETTNLNYKMTEVNFTFCKNYYIEIDVGRKNSM